MPTVVVTGGAGYIGSQLVGLLLQKSYDVLVLDQLLYGAQALLGFWYHPKFHFCKTDIADEAQVARALEGVSADAFVHFAAIVGDPACAKDPNLAERVNWQGACAVLAEARRHQIRRFIFASTCSNYGKMADPSQFVDEESPLSPVSHYAKLKVQFEKHLLGQKLDPNLCPTVLRFATAYGLSGRMRFDLTVNEFIKELALGRTLEVFGGEFWRPYCHVVDLARAVLLVLTTDQHHVAGEVFNVGDTGENYQKRMIVEEVKKILPQAEVRYVKKAEDPRDYRVSFEKIKSRLGFTITRRVPDGIREVKQALEQEVFHQPDSQRYKNS